MKRLLFLFLAVVLTTFGATAQHVNGAAVCQQINNAAAHLRSMQCDFVQTKYMRMLNDKLVSRGKMYYARPNKLRWEYTSPYTYTFVLNDARVMMSKGKKNQVINVNQSKVFKEITRIMMNSVVGKCLSDKNDFKTSIAGTSAEWVATLVPLKKNMKQMFSTIKIHFNKKTSMVTVAELTEKGGDRTVIQLTNVRKNQTINANLFKIR